ncbi:beta-galactosidase 15-like [Euphorbia lathyris]|uniref:beta-galactosidase 15-like n=1 Tax=Euphorbia lathyris TaxID=212925 RepID=UPI003313E3C8
MASLIILSSLCVLCFLAFNLLISTATLVSHDGRAIKIDGKRKVLISGSIHYPRSTAEMWPDLIKKSKEGGLDAIETYVFWNAHEPVRREYDFTGNLDLVRFIKTVQDAGLYAVLRIGPYVCAEWNYGGLPVWLHNLPGIELRTTNSAFMNEMKNFTTLIVDMMKKEKLFASQGGPIILSQIENEYGNVMEKYGDAAKSYVDWCANMAESLDIGVPWIMCQQSDAPKPMINTCNGWYCDSFTPNDADSPKMWTENWTGWFKSWGGKDPLRMAEDLAYSVARFFQTGGTFQNYYMYHGGTNFGRTAGGPYITTTYDYDAPLNEYGGLNQPKYGHLKQLHDVLHSIEDTLTSGNISRLDFGNSVEGTIFATEKVSTCFFSNKNTTSDATIEYKDASYTIPAWSVSILPDCVNVAYNTAKVKTQTSKMVKRKNEAEDEPSSLKWSWKPENNHKSVHLGMGHMHKTYLIDQKSLNDSSDYLWYMTSVHIKKSDPIWSKDMTLRVNGSGHILHAYVNGKYIGSQWAKYGVTSYDFEKSIKLRHGKNLISLLSSTIGLANYGPKYDIIGTGLVGPIALVGRKGDEEIIKDLSKHKWSYNIGFLGLSSNNQMYGLDSHHFTTAKWLDQNLPINRMMTWYQADFKAPLGNDPVVLDMLGMGKGFAWVNGNNIGRYWPSYLADETGCSNEECDYRGSYENNKCVYNCGKPTQRWYHVPRSFLKDGKNNLVLFEELGGNPTEVSFQTVSVGTVSSKVNEGETLVLSCEGKSISEIKFANFGDTQSVVGSFNKGTCSSEDTLSVVEKACIGQESCKIEAKKDKFGTTDCEDNFMHTLAVEALC